MKKVITIVIIILAVIGLGWYLFKISPQNSTGTNTGGFDLSNIKSLSTPRPVDAQDHILGNPNAKNTMVVYEDFQCPACAAYAPSVRQMPTVFKDTKVVVRHFPLYQIHKNAIKGAYAMEAASAQGKFWEMYDLIYSRQPEWAEEADPTDKLAEIAKAAGVADLEKFKSDMNSDKFKPIVETDLREGTALGVQGTPTFNFNGKVLQNGVLPDMEKEAEPYYFK